MISRDTGETITQTACPPQMDIEKETFDRKVVLGTDSNINNEDCHDSSSSSSVLSDVELYKIYFRKDTM